MINFLHFVVIVLALLSPFLVSWKVVGVFIVLYYLQLYIFGNCILTIKQFKEKDRDTSFHWYILNSMGIKFSKRSVRIFVDYYLPWILLIIAFVYQSY